MSTPSLTTTNTVVSPPRVLCTQRCQYCGWVAQYRSLLAVSPRSGSARVQVDPGVLDLEISGGGRGGGEAVLAPADAAEFAPAPIAPPLQERSPSADKRI